MTAPDPAPTRSPSALDAVADAHVDAVIALDPFTATALGVPGHDTEVPDLSPAGMDERTALARRSLARIAEVPDADEADAVTRAAMVERLETEIALDEAGISRGEVNNIASHLQSQGIFDLMPAETAEDWATITERLHRLPEALTGWTQTLRQAAADGVLSARRQLQLGAEQARGYATEGTGYFAALTARAPQQARPAVEAGAAEAARAYRDVADVLEELIPQGREPDAIGRELYPLVSQCYLGERIDLEETYAWGAERLREIIAEQESIARRINDRAGNGAGASVEAAREALTADPERTLHGTEALQAWMQKLSDQAVADLAGTHFDIPEPLRRLECRIAETGSGGIYYTGPSEDLSRPGRMWWDVPHGTERFSTWAETTTVYHEGVPGHHLQVGTQTLQAGALNRWRALMCWVSGHGEGWALYAERLMDQLGYLSDDGDRLGMLDAQRLRAGRVVLDIGLHCALPMPEGLPGSAGGAWTYEKAWEFMGHHWNDPEPQRRFELHRYLGWPGQAPSYAVGQRLWLQLRETSDAAGIAPRDFHRRALELGSLPLSVLREALA